MAVNISFSFLYGEKKNMYNQRYFENRQRYLSNGGEFISLLL